MECKKWMGHVAIFAAYFIFGFNIIVCKDLTSSTYLSPFGIFMLRSVGAGSIFWLLSLFTKHERVPLRDLAGIFIASIFGFFLTQLTFLMAIPMTSPLETSLISSLSPIFTMFIAAMVLREPITWKKAGGVALSFAGIIYIILTSVSGEFGSSATGILLMLANALCFSIYLGVFRPLIQRYSVVTFMKWIFLFSTLMSLPFATKEIIHTDFASLPSIWILELLYLIIMATFVAYFLIPFGQKIIRPTLVSMYSYVQPIVAISISICIGYDTLTIAKVIATLMVFGGVYLVSRSKSAQSQQDIK